MVEEDVTFDVVVEGLPWDVDDCFLSLGLENL